MIRNLLAILFVFGCLTCIKAQDTIPPVITLIYDDTTCWPINHPYTDPGATALDNGNKDVTTEIVVTGNLDVTKAGTYYIYYNCSDSTGNKAEEKTRVIYVVYSTQPLQWPGNPSDLFNIDLGQDFSFLTNPDSLEAYDSDSTDVRKKVIVTHNINNQVPGLYQVNYKLTGKCGQTVAGLHYVTVKDMQNPVVTLIGMPLMEICLNDSSFFDPGAVATDNSGSATLNNQSNVDVTRLGTYTICYNATDATGNRSDTVCRTIIVKNCGAGITRRTISSLHIYPNPTSEDLFVEGLESGDCLVSISDCTGKIMKTSVVLNTENKITVPVTELASGVYFLKVNYGSATSYFKFVVSR